MAKAKHKPLAGRDNDYLKIVVPAAARGDLLALEDYLGQQPDYLTCVGPHGRTLLWEAARGGKAEAVQWLAARGADVHVPGCYHSETTLELTPLAIAQFRKRPRAEEVLLELGAQADPYYAAYCGDTAFVRSALAADKKLLNRPFALSQAFAAPLLAYAVAAGHRKLASDLLELGARTTFPGERLLVWALWCEDVKLCGLLLEHGAVPEDGLLVEWAESSELTQLARKHGFQPDINGQNGNGFPPLVDACRGNHNAPDEPERVQHYLDLGADVMARDSKRKSALHRAAQAGFLAIPALLLQNGADLEAQDQDEQTPLFDAVRAGRADTTAWLLEQGANRDAPDRHGRPPVYYAKRSRKKEAARVLSLLNGEG